jgi:transposase
LCAVYIFCNFELSRYFEQKELYESYKNLQNDYGVLRGEYNNLKAVNERIHKEVVILREENAALKETAKGLIASIKQINDKLVDLAEKNANLTETVKKNSSNSSKPPSSDGYMKPAPKSLRKKTGKKVGGQQGHKGHGLENNREPDTLISHYPKECEICPLHTQGCNGCSKITKRSYVYNIEFKPVLIYNQVIQRDCPMNGGQSIKGAIPEEITGTIQYGDSLVAFAATLYARGMVSYKLIAELLDSAFGIPVSIGALPILVQKCVGKVMPAVEQIKSTLLNAPVINNDETGVRVEGCLHWAHVACNSLYTYIIISDKRGCESMNETGILPFFKGKSVHDCWSPYFTYPDIIHGLCNDHILRELQSVTDNQHQPWAEDMDSLLLSMKDERDANAAKGEVCSSESRIRETSNAYDSIIEQARIQNTSNKVNKKGFLAPISTKVAVLLSRSL